MASRNDNNFWINSNGTNTLKGIEGDRENPLNLPDEYIIHAIRTSQKARDDWNALFPSLLPEEQARLNELVSSIPYLVKLVRDGTAISDSEQRRFNQIPVYTAGRQGGRGFLRHALPNTYLKKND